MSKVLSCSILVAALAFPTLAVAEGNTWTREVNGAATDATVVAPRSLDTHFGLSSGKLNLCTVSQSTRYLLNVTPAEGVDLIERSDLDLQSLLGAAAFKANAALIGAEQGRDLTNPAEVRQLGRRSAAAADVRVESEEADLRLQLFAGSESCAGSSNSGGLRTITAAAEADECSGSCNCTTCVCSGSESCCDAGCGYCWGYLDGSGSC